MKNLKKLSIYWSRDLSVHARSSMGPTDELTDEIICNDMNITSFFSNVCRKEGA